MPVVGHVVVGPERHAGVLVRLAFELADARRAPCRCARLAPAGSSISATMPRTVLRSSARFDTYVGSQPVFWTTSVTCHVSVAERARAGMHELELR